MELVHFFVPDVGTGFVRVAFLILNLAMTVCAVSLLACMGYRFRHRKEMGELKIVRPGSVWWAFSILTHLAMVFVSFESSLDLSEPPAQIGISIRAFCHRVAAVTDPLLNLSGLRDEPLNEFLGFNLLLRVITLCVVAAVALFCYQWVPRMAAKFSIFLNDRILAPADVPLKKQTEKEEEWWATFLLKVLKLVIGGVAGCLIFYLVGDAELRTGISAVAMGVFDALKQVTLLDRIIKDPVGAAYFSNFLMIVVSLFILALYAMAAIFLCAFLAFLVREREKLIEKLRKHSKEILIGTAVVGILLVSISLIVLAFRLFQTEGIQKTIAGNAYGILEITGNILILFLALCFLLSALLLLIAFAILVGIYTFRVVQEKFTDWKSGNRKLFPSAKFLGVTAVLGGLAVALFLSHDQWMDDLAHMAQHAAEQQMTLWGLLGYVAQLFVLLAGLVLLAVVGLLLGVVVAKGLSHFFSKQLWSRAKFPDMASELVAAVVDFLRIIPTALKHMSIAGRSAVTTLLQVFTGYRNESEKNRAIFLAACFTSLASFLNTFFGLLGFYQNSKSWMLKICAFSISGGIQLAMLIFGMKAGEGFAQCRLRKADCRTRNPAEKVRRPPRTLSPWLYLVPYLLLLLISTGFAFTNMFGYYATNAHLHQQVYDQVRFQTDSQLGLIEKAQDIITDYRESENAFLAALTERGKAAMETQSLMLKDLENNVSKTEDQEGYTDWNRYVRYREETAPLEDAITAIQDVSALDYNLIGRSALMAVTEYTHILPGHTEAFYYTTYAEVKIGNESIKTIGTKLKEGLQENPVTGATEAITATAHTVSGLNKYGVLRELVNLYTSLENRVYSEPQNDNSNSNSDENDNNNDQNAEDEADPSGQISHMVAELLTRPFSAGGEGPNDLHSLLNESATIAMIYDNVTTLYKEEFGEAAEKSLLMDDLPGIVRRYLEGQQPEQSSTQKTGYQELEGYVDRALALYNFLSQGKAERGAPDEKARQLQSFAAGIASSNFQLGVNSLLCLRPTGDELNKIDALQKSWPIALLILIICALVDLMAFFAGLLLFKEVYLFRVEKALKALGYNNLEALLINLFTPPADGPERNLHLALLYYFLHGTTGKSDSLTQKKIRVGPQFGQLYALWNTREFQEFLAAKGKALEAAHLEWQGDDLGWLQTWLSAFVQERGITFDTLFPPAPAAPPAQTP